MDLFHSNPCCSRVSCILLKLYIQFITLYYTMLNIYVTCNYDVYNYMNDF